MEDDTQSPTCRELTNETDRRSPSPVWQPFMDQVQFIIDNPHGSMRRTLGSQLHVPPRD